MSSWWNQNDFYEKSHEESSDQYQDMDPEEAKRLVKEYYKQQRRRERKKQELQDIHLREYHIKHKMADQFLEDIIRRDFEIRQRDAKLLTKKGYGNKNNFKRLLPSSSHWRRNIRGEEEPHYVPGIYLYDTEQHRMVGYSSYN